MRIKHDTKKNSTEKTEADSEKFPWELCNLSEAAYKKSIALLKLFTIDGVSAAEKATPGQIEIFHAIISRKWDRVQIISSTQYGKSLFVALGCIILSCLEGEVISIVAPTNDKAQIIMRYYITHLSDNELFYKQLDKESSIDKLQMETKKDRVTLKNKGGVFTLSVQAGNTQKGFQAAMGEGSRIVIGDEMSLVPDEIEATIFRMIAGKADAVYIKVGNPFYRNHFFKSSQDPLYHQIFIDYKRGLEEGRYNEKFIEEAKKKPFFDILYGCIFPKDDQMDAGGWTRLFTDELLERAQRFSVMYGERRMGADIAEGGGDWNALVLRGANYAQKIGKFISPDTMQTTGRILLESKTHDVFDQNIFLDTLGVGKGPYDRMVEQKYQPYSVRFSESASDKTQFLNLRAECYWKLQEWLNNGGTLEPDPDWEELTWISYKVDSTGRIQIIGKDELRRRGYHSPDVADALASTFARAGVINISRIEAAKQKELLQQFDAHKSKTKIRSGRRY